MTKNHSRLIIVMLIAIIIVMFCNYIIGGSKQDPKVDSLEVGISDTQASEEIKEGEGTEEKAKEIGCEALENEEEKKKCINMIDNIYISFLESEIHSTFNIERCDELPDEKEMGCRKYIEDSGVKGPITQGDIAILKEASTLEECSDLESEGVTEYCKKKLSKKIDEQTLLKAIREKNGKICNDIKTEEYLKLCKKELGIKIEKPIIPKIKADDQKPKIPTEKQYEQEKMDTEG